MMLAAQGRSGRNEIEPSVLGGMPSMFSPVVLLPSLSPQEHRQSREVVQINGHGGVYILSVPIGVVNPDPVRDGANDDHLFPQAFTESLQLAHSLNLFGGKWAHWFKYFLRISSAASSARGSPSFSNSA
jgi:hypothetical protein